MGWTDRVKEAAKGLLGTEAGQDVAQTIRRKAEEELDAVLGGDGETKDSAPDQPLEGDKQ